MRSISGLRGMSVRFVRYVRPVCAVSSSGCAVSSRVLCGFLAGSVPFLFGLRCLFEQREPILHNARADLKPARQGMRPLWTRPEPLDATVIRGPGGSVHQSSRGESIVRWRFVAALSLFCFDLRVFYFWCHYCRASTETTGLCASARVSKSIVHGCF